MVDSSRNVFINPNNKSEYKCILFAVDIRTGWEWFGFEVVEKRKNGDLVLFGFVHGFEDEFGYFSLSELRENKVCVYTRQDEIDDIMPPIGWFRKDGDPE